MTEEISDYINSHIEKLQQMESYKHKIEKCNKQHERNQKSYIYIQIFQYTRLKLSWEIWKKKLVSKTGK